MDEPTELSSLSPDIVEDDQALGEAVDNVILLDPVARQRAAEIADHFEWLRAAVDSESWTLVLEVEARANERWADALAVVAKWSFAQGRRHPLKEQS